jgi:hypothetical protein
VCIKSKTRAARLQVEGVAGLRAVEREQRLQADVQRRHLERLEHELDDALAAARRVERRLGDEDRVLPRVDLQLAAHLRTDASAYLLPTSKLAPLCRYAKTCRLRTFTHERLLPVGPVCACHAQVHKCASGLLRWGAHSHRHPYMNFSYSAQLATAPRLRGYATS